MLNIPILYQEVEYIESTGTQFIDTNISQNIISSGFLRGMCIERVRYAGIYGYNSDNIDGFEISFNLTNDSGGYTYLYYYGEYTTAYQDLGTINDIIFEFDKQNDVVHWWHNDYQCDDIPMNGHDLTSNHGYLFGHQDNFSKDRLYSFKLYNWDNELIQDLVPCYRKTDMVAGLYDKVSGNFFTNNGTGTFLVGAIVNSTYGIIGKRLQMNSMLPLDYRQIEYIDSNGTEWLDTGIPMSSIGRGSIKFQSLQTSPSYTRMFGAEESSNTHGFDIEPYIDNDGIQFMFRCNGQYANNATYGAEIILRPLVVTFDFLSGTSPDLTIEGTSIGMEAPSDLVFTDYTACVFTLRRGADTHSGKIPARLYELQLWDLNNQLIQDLVPCYRKSDNEVGMYDRVSKTFKTNQGTGDFIAGPNKIIVG